MYNRRFSYYAYEVKVSIKHYAIESISKITMRKDKSTLSRNTYNHRSQSNWHEHLHAQSFCTRKQISSQSFCVYVCFFFFIAANNLHRHARRFVLFHHSHLPNIIIYSYQIHYDSINWVWRFVIRAPSILARSSDGPVFKYLWTLKHVEQQSHQFRHIIFRFFCPVWHPIIFIRRPHRTRKTKEIQCRKNSVYCIIIISRHCKSHIYYRDLTERLTQQWAFDEFNRVVRIPLLRIDQSTWCVV